MFWTEQNVRKIIVDFILKLSPDLPGREFEGHFILNDLEQDYGLSSMQIVELTAYVNSFFHLFDVAKPPNLLKDPFVNSWVKKILLARIEKDALISFHSSGTSGNAKLISHSIESLNREVSFLKEAIKQPKQILSFVPSNHIYGFLFTVALPQIWNIPVISVTQMETIRFEKSDLIVATPFNWHFIFSSLNQNKIISEGISSGAPLNDKLYQSLTEMGFNITEIYGSTETGGVGFRVAPNTPFTLFSYWEFNHADKIFRQYDHAEFQLMDHVLQLGNKQFIVQSRIDQVVQVGGVNINLESIKRKIESIEIVKKAAIYAKAGLSGTIIAASIELFNNSEIVKEKCMNEIYQRLEILEVPKHIVFLEG